MRGFFGSLLFRLPTVLFLSFHIGFRVSCCISLGGIRRWFLFLNTNFGGDNERGFFLGGFISLMFPSSLVFSAAVYLISFTKFPGTSLEGVFLLPVIFRRRLLCLREHRGWEREVFFYWVFDGSCSLGSSLFYLHFSRVFLSHSMGSGGTWFSRYRLRGCRDRGVISRQYRVSVVFIVQTTLFPCLYLYQPSRLPVDRLRKLNVVSTGHRVDTGPTT